MSARDRMRAGRDRGVGDWARDRRLIGMVKAQIHKVRVISRGDKWSNVKRGFGENTE